MYRPTRTRRFTIAASVSLLAVIIVAAMGVRSFAITDNLSVGAHQVIVLNRGCIVYVHELTDSPRHSLLIVYHPSLLMEEPSLGSLNKTIPEQWSFAGFWGGGLSGDYVLTCNMEYIGVPLWFVLLLLLIAPVRWLVARPANGPAFPVVTDAKQSN